MAPIPITIITGFLGSGKTTLILNLIPQLRATNPDYKLALLKNEFGDLAVDSQLASSSAISGVREMLNGCICCNLVGQLSEALGELRAQVAPDRIIIETSGSAFPATLAMEINRVARQTGDFVLDGVASVIDVENWKGYEDTSVTARLQAKYTDLIVFNKYVSVSWLVCCVPGGVFFYYPGETDSGMTDGRAAMSAGSTSAWIVSATWRPTPPGSKVTRAGSPWTSSSASTAGWPRR